MAEGGGVIARLAVAVQADTQRFVKGLQDAGKTAQNFAGSLKGIGVTAVFAAGTAALYGYQRMLSNVGGEIDKLAKTSAKLGLTVAELQRIQFAAEQSGVDVAKLNTAFQRLTRRTAEAARGTGEARAAFAELGIDAQRFLQLGAEDKMLLLADRFKNLETQADKVRVAFKLFDTEGVDLVNLLGAGSDGIAELLTQQEQMGTLTQEQAKGIEAANDALNRFSKSWENGKKQVASYGAEFRASVLNQLSRWVTIATGATNKQVELNQAARESAVISAEQAKHQQTLAALQEKRIAQMEEERARIHGVNEAAKALAQQLALQREQFGADSLTQQIRLLEIQGASRQQIEDLRYHQQKLKELESQKKAQDELRDSMDKMIAKAKELGKAEADPIEEYKQQILDLIAVARSGAITQEEFARAFRRTQEEFVAGQTSASKMSLGSIGSLMAKERGSMAAFESIDRAQKTPQNQLLDVQKKAQQTLRSIDRSLKRQLETGAITVQEVTI